MTVIAPGWNLDVERGPDWLIVALHATDQVDHEDDWRCPPLAESVWSVADQNFTYRVVLDMSNVAVLHTALIGQLVQLQKRICTHDGVLRLCGLSDHNREVVRCCRLDGFFPIFHDRGEAVMGSYVPVRPR
jgi:anti-anti-sigma factor